MKKSDGVLAFLGFVAVALGCGGGEVRTHRGEPLQRVQAGTLLSELRKGPSLFYEENLLLIEGGQVAGVGTMTRHGGAEGDTRHGVLSVKVDMGFYNFGKTGAARAPDPSYIRCVYAESEKPKLPRLRPGMPIKVIGRADRRSFTSDTLNVEPCEIEFYEGAD